MTRFEKEISGQLGEFWMKHAKEEVERLVEQAKTNATVEEDGAIRWNSSGNYIPDDCCEKLEYARFEFSREATRVKREKQTEEFITRYKAMEKEPSAEEIAEMRATFGPGTVVENILTGRRIQL